MEVIDTINQNWVNEIKAADSENRGIDLTEIMGKYSKSLTQLDQHFREAEQRLKPTKKRWRK